LLRARKKKGLVLGRKKKRWLIGVTAQTGKKKGAIRKRRRSLTARRKEEGLTTALGEDGPQLDEWNKKDNQSPEEREEISSRQARPAKEKKKRGGYRFEQKNQPLPVSRREGNGVSKQSREESRPAALLSEDRKHLPRRAQERAYAVPQEQRNKIARAVKGTLLCRRKGENRTSYVGSKMKKGKNISAKAQE